MTTVLFACIHNAGRSQMAAAFFNARADPAKARAISTGTEPGDSVHPEVVDAMREGGMDLSATHPRRLTPERAQSHVVCSRHVQDPPFRFRSSARARDRR